MKLFANKEKSRINEDLAIRLNENDFPILFEGLHTTSYLSKLINLT